MEVEESEFLPVGTVFLGNVDILEVEFVCRDVDLDVFAALELKMLSFRKFDSKLLMKVATLSLEMTSHSSFFTESALSAT